MAKKPAKKAKTVYPLKNCMLKKPRKSDTNSEIESRVENDLQAVLDTLQWAECECSEGCNRKKRKG